MLHDSGILTVYQLTDGSPDTRRLLQKSAHWYGERAVGVTRHYAALRASCKVDLLLEIWEDRGILAEDYCIPEDGEQYRIVQVQHTQDGDGLRVTLLSLERMDQNYALEEDTGGA